MKRKKQAQAKEFPTLSAAALRAVRGGADSSPIVPPDPPPPIVPSLKAERVQ
jgi:hypothetical protein